MFSGVVTLGGHTFSGEVDSGRVRLAGKYEGHPQSDESEPGRGV